MSKRLLLALFGIAIIIVFIISMQLFANAGDSCTAMCLEQASNYCNGICAHYGSQCQVLGVSGKYCNGEGLCHNEWTIWCENGRKFYYHCDVWDPACA
jgi:hypothetical protein